MARFGETLRAQREKKGITLEQAASDTRIREKFLKALEDSDYQTLPGAVYTKGFLRNYAEYLELPTEELVVQFHQERDQPDAPRTFKPLNPIARRSYVFTPAVLVPVVVLAGIVLFVELPLLPVRLVRGAAAHRGHRAGHRRDRAVGRLRREGTHRARRPRHGPGVPGPADDRGHQAERGRLVRGERCSSSRGSNHIVVEVLDTTGKVARVSRTVRLEAAGGASPAGSVAAIVLERDYTRQ